MARRVAAALGAVTLVAGANPHAEIGGYQPVSNVVEHGQMVYDIKDIGTETGAGNYAAAKAIYTGGRYSCKSQSTTRKMQGFVDESAWAGKLNGTAFSDSFTGGAGPSAEEGPIPGSGRLNLANTFWDDFVVGAWDGTGAFAGLSAAMRKTAAKKGVLGILTMYTARELESAISKAADGETEDGRQAPHAWDEGWAFYYGNYESEAVGADTGKYSAWEFTKKRDLDFAYDSSNNRVTGAVEGKVKLLEYFRKGLRASRAGTVNVAEMVEARDDIYRMLALASIRAALKYAEKTQLPSYNDEYHMEAYAYFLAAAGWVEQAAPGVGTAVLALLDYTKTEAQLSTNLYCEVKKKLIPAYEPLGLDCDMVGTWKSHNTTLDDSCTGVPACPAAATLRSGLATYSPDTTTSAGSNVDCGVPLVEETEETTTQGTSGARVAACSSLAWLAALSLLRAA